MATDYVIEHDLGKAPLGHVWTGRDRFSDVPVVEALAVAHDAGVLHRQMHEDLIIVDDAGTPELTGFGLTVGSARRVRQIGAETVRSRIRCDLGLLAGL